MARIAGIDLPRNKRIEIALTYIYGIGRSTAQKILAIRDLQQAFRRDYQDITPGMRDVNFLSVLFAQPYCRIGNVVAECHVSRQSASSWLDALVQKGAIEKFQAGRDRLFLNRSYLDPLTRIESLD